MEGAATNRRLGSSAVDLALGQDLVREYVEYTCAETGITLEQILPHIDDYQDYESTFCAPGCGFLVAETGTPSVATGSVGWRRIDDERVSMNRLWVRAPYRRGGVARALCLAVLDAAADDGYRTMLLDVSVTRPGAIALYESLGFVETEPLHRYEFPMRYFARSLAGYPRVGSAP